MPVSGDSMEEESSHGDWLLVDTSLPPVSGKIAIIEIDGDYTVKRLSKRDGRLWLVPDNKQYRPVEVKREQECKVWGMVTHIIKQAL